MILYGKYSGDYCFFGDRPIYRGNYLTELLENAVSVTMSFFIFAGELSSAAGGRPRV